MAEWLKAHAWKACKRETVSRVRIPLSPPFFKDLAQPKIYNKIVWSSYGRQHMKKLTVSLIFLFCSANLFAEDYHARTSSDNSQRIWNLKTAEEIGYKQFLVETVTRKTAERIKYNIVLVREFHENYCDKRPGNYPATKTMLNFGKIDIKNYKVKVKFLKGINNSFDYNVVEYKTPYKKFINWYDVENGQTTPYLYVVCKKTKGNSSEFYSRSELIGKDINFNNSEYKSRVIYDCDRTMEGFVRGLFFNPDIKFKNSEIKWRPPDKGTVGESNIKNVCNKLNLNGRF